MHKNLVHPEHQDLSEEESIANVAVQTDQSFYPADIDFISDAETDQDSANAGVLFRPRLRFVSL